MSDLTIHLPEVIQRPLEWRFGGSSLVSSSSSGKIFKTQPNAVHPNPISRRLYTIWSFGIIRVMTKAIIYTRVSTSEQGESGLGLEAQAAVCKDYCARNRLEIVEVTTEVQSGKSTRRRPVLAAALESLRNGDADVLIASNVSRLSRSIGDLVGLISEADKRGYSVVALDTGLDTSTSAGRMVFQMLGVAAEY